MRLAQHRNWVLRLYFILSKVILHSFTWLVNAILDSTALEVYQTTMDVFSRVPKKLSLHTFSFCLIHENRTFQGNAHRTVFMTASATRCANSKQPSAMVQSL